MKKSVRITLLIIPPFLILIILLIKDIIINAVHFPRCKFNELTGYYCPACGNTRCVLSMLELDFIKAVKYNITPILLSVIAVLFYLELFIKTLGIKINLVPRSNVFLFSLLSLTLIYYIARNFIPALAPMLY